MTSVIVMMAALLPAQSGDAPKAGGSDKVFVGYLFGPVRDIDYKLYTHLCHAFATADGDGKLRPSRNVPSRELTTQAHAAGVKVLVSAGGWGWDKQFAAIVASKEAEHRYVGDLLAMVRDYDYDGIDLDWEYPDADAEVPGFERLTRRLRAGVDAIGREKGRRMFITMAMSSNPGTIRWLSTEFLVETMDWINVMTYDYTGDWTEYAGHQSPLFASSKQPGRPRSTAQTVEYMLNDRKVPADRIALGIPLYGRGFPVAEPYASTKGAPKVRLPGGSYRNLAELAAKGWTRVWDDETKNPWLLAPDRKAVIGYDDAESVELKAKWAREKGLRGVFFWQVHGDRMPDGTNPLQKAARKGLFGG
ncbi:Chitinase A1 precursor [Aquisphaera giovannonii]|uniref:chitinase n=1 Tax=Aquisphaera giovannonii TaxID=406548 RepID=A0A5B9W1Y4_9BACT|nr:glycoside hydrolase family 18 protein [Aquisphaera giovannonii]QEH34538.1 Chitinase A1 precursor [Aquisphaera giovannonii]